MGTTALVADYNGIARMEHVRAKLAEMISVAELVYASGIAAGVKSRKAPSGTQIPQYYLRQCWPQACRTQHLPRV
jgi:Aromatic ring hydroxylase